MEDAALRLSQVGQGVSSQMAEGTAKLHQATHRLDEVLTSLVWKFTATTLGSVIYVGGADRPVFVPGTRQVKTFDPLTLSWEVQPDLTDSRWYPTMVPLPNGELLAVGGGDPVRPSLHDVAARRRHRNRQ